jgi:predicted nucleic acid-binding protein
MIRDLSEIFPEDFPFYFIDTNIWIAYIKRDTQKNKFEPYFDFIDGIVNINNSDVSTRKRIKNIPKIILSSVLLSEIINAYLRRVAMRAFYNDKLDGKDFKKDYRDFLHSDYPKQVSFITSEIMAFESVLHLQNDGFDSDFDISTLVNLGKNDFNDFYYSAICSREKIPILTEDFDFTNFKDNISIFTKSAKILQLK